jgi:light-regulated signal transduction histidine kinase (bacteriophytochrome)
VDADHALDEALVNLASAIREAQAEVERDKLPQILAAPTQLIQLFQNLMGNAIKFREPGKRPHVKIGARKENGEWLMSVSDNGIGIPSNQKDRIFQVFQRLHTRDTYPGTGIGLSICKRIVERHGGCIGVESAEGQGSAFLFTIPDPNIEGPA